MNLGAAMKNDAEPGQRPALGVAVVPAAGRRGWFRNLGLAAAVGLVLGLGGMAALGQGAGTGGGAGGMQLNIGLDGLGKPGQVDTALQVLFAITLLSLAPSIVLLMTCFTRIAIVLSFVRHALSLQGAPANQIIIGLSLFLTFFIMNPVWQRVDAEALRPYRDGQLNGVEALQRATVPVRAFMLKQSRPRDVELFVGMAKLGATQPEELPLKVVVPAFILSELRTAFQMGFLLFVPFIVIDLVVATVLMSMGMFMMPPTTISLPLKILLFVLVDGWNLVVRSVVLSFAG
jgi:flagellar biosynthetic protein FliP